MKIGMWEKMKERKRKGYVDQTYEGEAAEVLRNGTCWECGCQLYEVDSSDEIYKGENHIICRECGWNAQVVGGEWKSQVVGGGI